MMDFAALNPSELGGVRHAAQRCDLVSQLSWRVEVPVKADHREASVGAGAFRRKVPRDILRDQSIKGCCRCQ
jgi:hypothetical protein